MASSRIPGLALCAALLLAAGAPAGAQVEAKRRELGRIQKELEKTKAELEEYRRQEAGLSREARQLASHDAQTRRRIEVIQKNIRQAEGRRTDLKSRVGALSLASGFWTSVLASELSGYARALAGREEAWGGSDLWSEAFRRAALLEKANIVANLRGYRLKTEAAAAAAHSESVALQDRSRRAQAEERSVRQEYELKRAAVSEARGKVEAVEKHARELEETKLALAQLLTRLGGADRYERQGTAGRLDLPKSSLPWPVEGSVARPFGRERNPELNSWVIRQGVTFATRPGAAVTAVGAGRVIYSGPFRSYGKVVIVDHGGGFFSIYGELGDILATKGRALEAGMPVGTAGACGIGSSAGADRTDCPTVGVQGERGVLYLELRRGTEALDPMVWLKKK